MTLCEGGVTTSVEFSTTILYRNLHHLDYRFVLVSTETFCCVRDLRVTTSEPSTRILMIIHARKTYSGLVGTNILFPTSMSEEQSGV